MYPLFPDLLLLLFKGSFKTPVRRFIPDVHGISLLVCKSVTADGAFPLLNHQGIWGTRFKMLNLIGGGRGIGLEAGGFKHFRQSLGRSRGGGAGGATRQADGDNPNQNEKQ
ncbi:MAG: hypothetical protein FJ121_01165 [Deltaproteobacteria bacterium]|nr:hypothetical protein [Deltaproteobacteria bacterium]